MSYDKYTTIPEGMVKIPWIKILHKDNLDIFVNQILKMMVRDYHLFYSLEIQSGDYLKVHLYCYPSQQFSVVYNIGVYWQVMFNNLTQTEIELAIHRPPDGFPDCIRIDFEKHENEAA